MKKNILKRAVMLIFAVVLTLTCALEVPSVSKAATDTVKRTNLGKITNLKYSLSGSRFKTVNNRQLYITWTKSKKVTGYVVTYKLHSDAEDAYQKLATTKKGQVNVTKFITDDNTYDFKIEAYKGSGSSMKYNTAANAKVITVNLSTYYKENKDKLLAAGVKTIYKPKNYTKNSYTTEVKEAFVNSRNLTSSTPYLIWTSNYTQQVTIFKKVDGRWKQIRTFKVGTGKSYLYHGKTTIKYKESAWKYNTTQVLYISHFQGRNSFHTIVLNYGGSAAYGNQIGHPVSHGCIRCRVADAKYIYNNMPRGTRVYGY